MPVEAKPLFRPDALRPHLKTFQLPKPAEEYRAILGKWAEMLHPGRPIGSRNKRSCGDFLADVFCSFLGYTRPADDPERHTFSREKHVQVDGKFADAVLGDFRDGDERFIVALEGKGPKDPLTAPSPAAACRQSIRATATPSTFPATGSLLLPSARPAFTTRVPTNTPTSGSTPKSWPATKPC